MDEFPSAQLSFNAMSGIQDSETIRVLGHFTDHPVHIFVDGGSTFE